MEKKILFLILIFVLLFEIHSQLYNVSIPYGLCELEGFTIIVCSPPLLELDDYGIRNSYDAIKLLNGMIFKPVGIGPLSLGPNVIILARMIKVRGKEKILYKLISEPDPMIYDVIRIR